MDALNNAAIQQQQQQICEAGRVPRRTSSSVEGASERLMVGGTVSQQQQQQQQQAQILMALKNEHDVKLLTPFNNNIGGLTPAVNVDIHQQPQHRKLNSIEKFESMEKKLSAADGISATAENTTSSISVDCS